MILSYFQRRQYLDNYGSSSSSSDGFLGKKILPTLGVSFGLPQYGGGYPLNPFGANPAINPYGNVIGGGGINLGLVSVNPLVSFQLTKNEDGDKIFKPFVNLHVTPNDFLVHKVGSYLYGKKQQLHHHLHHHAYPPPPYYGHRPPYYPHGPPPLPPPYPPKPYPPIYEPIHDAPPHYHKPHHHHHSPPPPPFPPHGPPPPGPPLPGPPPFIYRDRPAPSSHRLPHYYDQEELSPVIEEYPTSSPSYFDDTATNYGGGFAPGTFGSYSRVYQNTSNPIKFNSIQEDYKKIYQNQDYFYNPGETLGSVSGGDSLEFLGGFGDSPSRRGKSFTFPPDGRSDRVNLVTFRKTKVRKYYFQEPTSLL